MDWQPIETAPKDGTRILLFRPSNREWAKVVCGEWNDDRHASAPKPYFRHDHERLEGRVATRKIQPTHWMPLPAPPEGK